MSEDSYFDAYWKTVARALGCDPRQKTSWLRIATGDVGHFDSGQLASELLLSMQGDRWKDPKSISSGNWDWRATISDSSPKSKEVALERAVVDRGGTSSWTYQMSTASGLHGPHSGRRRAIDLVRHHGDDRYSFVELKVKSDHPLYAAFEILGYGLAYLHSRRCGLKGTGDLDVMAAKRISLVVLGPEDWYRYSKQGLRIVREDLDGLAKTLEDGLASLMRSEANDPPEGMHFRFESFEYAGDPRSDAADICRRF